MKATKRALRATARAGAAARRATAPTRRANRAAPERFDWQEDRADPLARGEFVEATTARPATKTPATDPDPPRH